MNSKAITPVGISSSPDTSHHPIPQLPLFSLPQGTSGYSETMTPENALNRIEGAKSGFIGNKVAVLVVKTLT